MSTSGGAARRSDVCLFGRDQRGHVEPSYVAHPRPLALLALVVVGVVPLAGGLRADAATGPDKNAEVGFVSRISMERANGGLNSVQVADDLVSIARSHSQQMADEQRLYDDPNMGSEVQGWQSIGGNAGEGGSVDDVHRAFMASPEHRDNILDRSFSEIGVGVVWTSRTLWVTEVFRQPSATPPSAAAASASVTTPPSTATTVVVTRAVAVPAARPTSAPATTAATTTSTEPPTTVAQAPATVEPAAAADPSLVDEAKRLVAGSSVQAPAALGGYTLGVSRPLSRRVPLGVVAVALALLLLNSRGVWRAVRVAGSRGPVASP